MHKKIPQELNLGVNYQLSVMYRFQCNVILTFKEQAISTIVDIKNFLSSRKKSCRNSIITYNSRH